ncbi:MAG: aldehyde dehydrogenase family protein [Candidatus Thiodiazotropha sp. (ex. Lucinoma kazani)]
MAAALAVGCTIVLKPAEMTPMSILYVMKIFKEAGLPDGVINIVTGKGSVIGNRLAAHPDINKVSFTGSTPTGQTVGKAAIEGMKHLTLELGGKSAMIAFEDARISDAIVEGARASVFFNAGQVCSAGSRLYVHKEIYPPGHRRCAGRLTERGRDRRSAQSGYHPGPADLQKDSSIRS